MAGAEIEIRGISKKYKNVKVLEDVNLKINQGDFLTILGPSGAGKTTLLKMIAGFEQPESGEIYVDGEDILKKPVHKRNIGMLFQNYALFPHMTVRENIAYPLKIRKMKKQDIEEKVLEILKYIQLEKFAERYPRQLSGGQQQRVALGRAIVFKPRVLLLDEPLGALDKQLRKQMQLEIKRMHEDMGLTTISVTHDQEEALTMSTKVCVMKNGMIAQVSTPERIYSKPKNVFVATFIGEANIINTKVKDSKGDLRCVELFGKDVWVEKGPYYLEKNVETSVVIRPEKIHLVNEEYDGLKFGGLVQETIYIGDILKIKMRMDNGDTVDLKIFTSAETRISIGDKIWVSFSEKDVELLVC